MNPCVEYCYNRFGRQYSSECDNDCDYAKEVRRRKNLENVFRNTRDEILRYPLKEINVKAAAHIIDKRLEEFNNEYGESN